ncbi:hypothetical protein [Priestia megaterium]|uniref:hypothetical protein n=1 Tax=Priestia megaterium TaxID=1404 RepID=UPI0011B4B53B|nr:hypothetical protein [Priestia megaterium]QDZ88736.1 hypothetical protein D0441_31390 [Priestia megaterium]
MINKPNEDEKMEYVTNEIMGFIHFLGGVSGETYELNLYTLTEKLAPFYVKNEAKYNKEQLVNQFLKSVGGISLIKAYTSYKKAIK